MNRQRTYSILGALTALVAVGVVVGIFVSPSSSLASDTMVMDTVSGPDEFLAAGGKSAVVTDISPKVMNMKRGESATFTISLTHNAATTDFKTLNIVAAGVNGMLGLPSSVNSTTVEEKVALLEQGKTVPGLIPLSTFVTYSPAQIMLDAGETKSITATVTIPKTLPDEMVGKSIHINPDLKVIELQDAPPERQSDVVVFGDVLSIVVES